MFVYIAVAAISCLLLSCSNYFYISGKRGISSSLIAASILLFCVVAAFRSLEVGTDVLVYGQPFFNYAKANDIYAILTGPRFSDWGLLYITYSWIVINLFGNINAYFFALQLLITIPTYIAILRINRRYAYLGVAVYGLFFFPISLNMMRQSVAMAFILLMMTALINRNWREAFLWFAVAVLFHDTALICGVLFILVFCIRKASAATTIALLSLLLITLYAGYPLLVDFLADLGWYDEYINGSISELVGGGRLNFELTGVLLYLLLLFMYFRNKLSGDFRLTVLFCFVLLGVLGGWLSIYAYYLYRVGLYFLVASMLLLPYCVGQMSDRKTAMAFAFVTVFFFVVIHIDYFVICGAHQVIPYVLSA